MKFNVTALSVALVFTLPNANVYAESDPEQRQSGAATVIDGFAQRLGGALQKTMKEQGPAAAISVCSDLAPAIASELSRERGWQVKRVSDRPRNPMLGMTDAWEAQVLDQFRQRANNGGSLAELRHAATVEENGQRYFRYMQAIGIKPVCLTCHGNEQEIPQTVSAALAETYPHDRATGYQTGQLRGAFSIKQPLSATTDSTARENDAVTE